MGVCNTNYIFNSINYSGFIGRFIRTFNCHLNDTILHWKSGPFNGKIVINSITKITHHNGIIVPTFWKPALSHIGLIITYNKFDDIYISPERSAEFLSQLIKINPNITIKN